MSEQADAPEREDEELLQPEAEAETPEVEETEEPEPSDEADPPEGEEPEDEFDEVSFGDEAAPASRGTDSDLAKHLRQEIRKRDEELARYKRGEIPTQPQAIERKPKPTLEGCDYDGDKFEVELLSWNENERKATEAETQAQQQSQAEQERFGQRLQAYSEGQKTLKVRDFDVAEDAVLAGLTQVQQATLLLAADEPARMVYALGRHPEKLKTLAAITNPIEFTKAAVKLEGQLKVTSSSRTPPEPDRPQRGSAPLSRGTDKNLERLEREAEKSGDRTAVVRYKREQRDKAQQRDRGR